MSILIYLVPTRDKILHANKKIHKVTRAECIEIIDKYHPELEASE